MNQRKLATTGMVDTDLCNWYHLDLKIKFYTRAGKQGPNQILENCYTVKGFSSKDQCFGDGN